MKKIIKLSLLGALLTSSTIAIMLPIVSCSGSDDVSVDNNIISAIPTDLENATNSITKLLKEELEVGKTNYAKKLIVEEWKVGKELDNDYLEIIKNTLNFKNASNKKVTGDEAIESVTFNSDTIISEPGQDIISPKLKVNFKNQFISSPEVLIEVKSLGEAPTNLLANEKGLENAIDAITNLLIDTMFFKNTRNEQEELLKSWTEGEEIETPQLNVIKQNLNFNINGVSIDWDEAIDSVTFNFVPELPEKDKEIPGLELKVNFKSQYASPDFIIKTGNIGIAK